MERTEWLHQMRSMSEAIYNQLSPDYWVRFGLYPNETHQRYLQKFLGQMAPHSALLSAACGAGRYDGMLLKPGHSVVGTDQSEGMLARAREHFPQVRYEKVGLQEMAFHEAFDGAICMDAMEHICPEDWPIIFRKFCEALKPGGVLYFTVEVAEDDEVQAAYERAKAQGLPVVFGEVVEQVDVVYHYYPSLEQVRAWLAQAGFAIDAEGAGDEYEHFVVRKK